MRPAFDALAAVLRDGGVSSGMDFLELQPHIMLPKCCCFPRAMSDLGIKPYPGANASPAEIMALGDEYFSAAEVLMERGRPRMPLSRAPARLCAIHAIELYLNAFLLGHGTRPETLRAHSHNLAERTELAIAQGLVLRKRTQEHLIRMTEEREYLVSRYGPESRAALSEVNRLMATLREVAARVRSRVASRA